MNVADAAAATVPAATGDGGGGGGVYLSLDRCKRADFPYRVYLFIGDGNSRSSVFDTEQCSIVVDDADIATS